MALKNEEIVDDIKRLLDRPVVLIGMMGAGKTRLGRQIAGALGLSFSDSDDEIEKASGLSIPEIFDRFGESYFRDGERRVIARLLEQGVSVIATGGGAVMNEDTAKEIWSRTRSVWVRAEMDVMLERVSRKDNRPLLQKGDPRQILTDFAAARYPVYEKADVVIDSHNGPSEAILNQALDKIYKFLRHEQRKAG